MSMHVHKVLVRRRIHSQATGKLLDIRFKLFKALGHNYAEAAAAAIDKAKKTTVGRFRTYSSFDIPDVTPAGLDGRLNRRSWIK